MNRRECDQVAQELRAANIAAEPYHAGLSDSKRTEIQERWINEDHCKVSNTYHIISQNMKFLNGTTMFWFC